MIRRRLFPTPPIGTVRGIALACALLALPVWADGPARQALTLESGGDEYTLRVETAKTPQERSQGLMERDALPADAGMLFLYAAEQPSTSAYWMYKTRIPLDIAFVDGDGIIRSLKTMPPCTTAARDCPSYPAGAAFRAALEVNAGYFAKRGIGVGDAVDLAPWLAR